MSFFGKVLAVANIFGMVFLFTMAIMVYAKQQAWKFANYRFDVAYEGLPLHKEETDLYGNPKYLNVNKQCKASYSRATPW